MIPVADALKTVLNASQRLPAVTVPLHDALGKVLAQDVCAPDPLPPYPASVKVTLNTLCSFLSFFHVFFCYYFVYIFLSTFDE